MARIFSAIDIEDQEVLHKLGRLRDRLNLDFKHVNKEKMHITLQFFEDLKEKEIEEVKNSLENIEADPFKLKIEGIGAFPSEEYIRVIWSGAEHPEIYKLQEQVAEHRVESDDNHEFKPHITLLRIENLEGRQKKKLEKAFEEHRNEEIGEIEVDKIKLFRSDLTPEGAKYTKVAEKKL